MPPPRFADLGVFYIRASRSLCNGFQCRAGARHIWLQLSILVRSSFVRSLWLFRKVAPPWPPELTSAHGANKVPSCASNVTAPRYSRPTEQCAMQHFTKVLKSALLFVTQATAIYFSKPRISGRSHTFLQRHIRTEPALPFLALF